MKLTEIKYKKNHLNILFQLVVKNTTKLLKFVKIKI